MSISDAVWQTPDYSRGRRTAGLASINTRRGSVTAAARVRAVGRTPEAVMKIGKWYNSKARVMQALSYITRDGETQLELRDGIVLGFEDADARKELADQWEMTFRDRKNARNAVPIILSAPIGSPPEALRRAARNWASRQLAPDYDYAFALHTDEPHPHIHFVVVRDGLAGKNLGWTREELDDLRAAFAAACREEGLMLNATPRRVRGKSERGEAQAARHIRMREGTSFSDLSAAHEVIDGLSAQKGQRKRGEWYTAMSRRAEYERQVYEELAGLLQRLSQNLKAEDRETVATIGAMIARQSMALRQLNTRRSRMEEIAIGIGLKELGKNDKAARMLAMLYRADQEKRRKTEALTIPAKREIVQARLETLRSKQKSGALIGDSGDAQRQNQLIDEILKGQFNEVSDLAKQRDLEK